MDSLAKRLKSERERQGLSQPQLAARAGHGVKQQTIGQIEHGQIQRPRALIYIADALNVSARWLLEGGPRKAADGKLPPVDLRGHVGAGAEVAVYDEHPEGADAEAVPPFPGQDGPALALRVRGDSMLPIIEDGSILYYTSTNEGVTDDCIGKLCVVQVHDGPMLVKKLERGRRKGLYRLVSYNASPREDVRLDWAARVRAIVP